MSADIEMLNLLGMGMRLLDLAEDIEEQATTRGPVTPAARQRVLDDLKAVSKRLTDMHAGTTRIPFALEDLCGKAAGTVGPMQAGSISLNPHGLGLRFDGYGDCTSADGYGEPVFIEHHDGNLRVLVWDDINQEDPTLIAGISGARESRRKPEETPCDASR
jgi:hypothetical protein